MTAGAVLAPLIIPIIQLQPPRAKNHINTNTPVSIQSDTPGVQIFYTVDGSKPAAVQRGSAGSSKKYSEPILLPAGRVAVRAVAVTSDGRESSTVTKVFSVELTEWNKKENEEFLQSNKQCLSVGTPCSTENSAGSSLKPPEPRMIGSTSPQSGPRFLHSQLRVLTPAEQTGHSRCSESAGLHVLNQLSSLRMSQINRETAFLRCPQCSTPCPSDPFARFCPHCGTVVPSLHGQRLPPGDEGQDHVMCVSCGSGNPAHVSSCLTCETHLKPVVCVGHFPSVPSAGSMMLSCSRCKRINHHDARFCDWCSSKLSHAAICVICCQCGAQGHPYAFYCTNCGVFLDAPALPTSYSDITQSVSSPSQATPSSDPKPKVRLTTPTAEQNTQTVGLYYPSAIQLQKVEQERTLYLSRQQSTRDRKPLLTAISPGRGYWRKQLDHVCAHLRSYTQNNAPFRALLGEPRLGQMVSAVIQEDRYEVSLTISFVLAGREGKQVEAAGGGARPNMGGTEILSSIIEGSAEHRSDHCSSVIKPNATNKPVVKDTELVKELGLGRGRVRVIQQLLDQGADPSCCNRDGQHALAVAVVNGHHDVLPVLLQRGADVNQQSGQMKNSALHEAAAQGSEGLQCAQVLLSCKASVRQRNASGQTPYDMAVISGCNRMMSLLAAQTGLDLVGKLTPKPRQNLEVF